MNAWQVRPCRVRFRQNHNASENFALQCAGSVEGSLNELERRGDINGALDRARHGAMLRVHAVHALNGFALRFGRPQPVMRVNTPDDQHSAVHFNFPRDFRSQFAVAGVNLARFQRASKSAGQSSTRRGHHIVQGGCT